MKVRSAFKLLRDTLNYSSEKILSTPLLLLFGFQFLFLIEYPFFERLPENEHLWRQSHTLTVARNFYEEDMNIMNLRVNNRLNQSGVTGGHFPAYEWGLAVLYKIFGEQKNTHRIWSFSLFIMGGIGMFYWVRLIFHKKADESTQKYSVVAANVACWFFWLSPEMVYHGINALPDILAICASIWGGYFIWKWLDEEAPDDKITYNFYIGLLLLILAGLTKLQYLAIGFPIAAKVFINSGVYLNFRKNRKSFFGILVLAFLCTLIPLAWYIRAKILINSTGLRDFGIHFKPETDWSEIKLILKINFEYYFPFLFMGMSGWFLIFSGWIVPRLSRIDTSDKAALSISSWLSGKQKLWIPIWVWFFALFIYYVIELEQMKWHPYYLIPFLPLFGILAAHGAIRLLAKKWAFVILLALLYGPISAYKYTVPWRRTPLGKDVPKEFLDNNSLQKLKNATPKGSKVILGPDISKCIHFYFLNKKGVCFVPGTDITSIPRGEKISLIEQYSKFADYLYFYSKDVGTEKIDSCKFVGKKILQEGDYHVYELKKNPKIPN